MHPSLLTRTRLYFRKYGFLFGLLVVTAVTLADHHEWTVNAGRWLKTHHGPDITIFAIFFFSGLTLDGGMLHKGLRDLPATLITLAIIFVFSPLIVLPFCLLPLDIQIITGLLLVAVMPSTLSSGVVMTAASGGNSAHALFVTIVSNALSVFTVPLILGLLLSLIGDSQMVTIDKSGIMIKIAALVLLPLVLGMSLPYVGGIWIEALKRHAQWINQLLVLCIVWMGTCLSRSAVLAGGKAIMPIIAIVLVYHLLLLLLAMAATRIARIGPGRRESVIFIGGQKTLTLSIILQVAVFPSYGLALVVCVVHHIVHLFMDAYLVGKLKQN